MSINSLLTFFFLFNCVKKFKRCIRYKHCKDHLIDIKKQSGCQLNQRNQQSLRYTRLYYKNEMHFYRKESKTPIFSNSVNKTFNQRKNGSSLINKCLICYQNVSLILIEVMLLNSMFIESYMT